MVYSLEITGKRLVENKYCIGNLPVNLVLGQGVGLDLVVISDKTSNLR